MDLDKLYKETLNKFKEYVELLYIKYTNDRFIEPQVNVENLEAYLHRLGFVPNFVLGEKIYTRNFTCIKITPKCHVNIWTDKCKNSKAPCVIKDSQLTSLPIFINYFDR